MNEEDHAFAVTTDATTDATIDATIETKDVMTNAMTEMTSADVDAKDVVMTTAKTDIVIN